MPKPPDDLDTWQREIADVKPLAGKPKSEPEREPAHPVSSAPTASSEIPTVKINTHDLPPLTVGGGGVDAATMRKLKRGQMQPQATLDLHSMTQAQAYQALQIFIPQQVEQQHKLILVVTGKGSISKPSVLKTNLPIWLNASELRPYIIAIDQAHPRHGGSGAFYILLRKRAL